MKVKNDIVLSTIHKENSTLIYFNVDEVKNSNKIKKAYITIETSEKHIQNNNVNIFLNTSLDIKDLNSMFLSNNIKQKPSTYETYKKYIDITEKFHLLASGIVKNNGLTLTCSTKNNTIVRLHLVYTQDKIIPKFNQEIFYEEEIVFSSKDTKITSPWFLIKNSKVVSFYIKNISKVDIIVSLQNSPNSKDITCDAQKVIISPKATSLLIPAVFSKYVRVVVNAETNGLGIKLWFQTQALK